MLPMIEKITISVTSKIFSEKRTNRSPWLRKTGTRRIK
jgi:hypothetical protein